SGLLCLYLAALSPSRLRFCPNIFCLRRLRSRVEGLVSSRSWITLSLCTLLATPSFADFRYAETTQITGGSVVGMMKFAGAFSKDAKKAMDPVTSTVLVQGNRMARINPDHTEIIDLDKETITTIDHGKKQYTVVTF